MTAELCGHPMRTGECGKPKGHTARPGTGGDHTSIDALERSKASTRANNARIRNKETVCARSGCNGVSPTGYVLCIECQRTANDKWRATPKGQAKRKELIAKWNAENRQARSEISKRWSRENPIAVREATRRRRERKANARYEQISCEQLLQLDDSKCYLCGDLIALETMQVEHVIPIARFADYAADVEGDFVSGLRAACGMCNRSKHDKDPASYALQRFHAKRLQGKCDCTQEFFQH